MSTHISASKDEIASTVLLPGDPLRAKWMATTYLDHPFAYNHTRGMHGYTGTYKGVPVSIQGTGIGIPSTLIYCHELINNYGVKNLIRVGSAGSYSVGIELNDLVVALAASHDSNFNSEIFGRAHFSPSVDILMLRLLLQQSEKHEIPVTVGGVFSTDQFYETDQKAYLKWAEYGILAVEMETAGLYTIAAKYGVRALSLLTISDSLVSGDKLSSEQRESSFHDMTILALETMLSLEQSTAH